MKNNFDDRLKAILADIYDTDTEPFDHSEVVTQIKAEIASQMPKEDRIVDITELVLGIADIQSWAMGYNQALQEVKEALQLEGKKE